MASLTVNLTNEEKTFLAGCVKAMIMVDGLITPGEVEAVTSLYQEPYFQDFEERLQDFENRVKDADDFWKMAKKITNPETREYILAWIYEIAREDGGLNADQKHFFKEMEEFWE